MIEVQKFEANWCNPCKMLAPTIEALKSKYPSVVFTNIDVDADQKTAQASGIRNIPMVIIRKNGEITDRIAGVNPSSLYEQKIENLL